MDEANRVFINELATGSDTSRARLFGPREGHGRANGCNRGYFHRGQPVAFP